MKTKKQLKLEAKMRAYQIQRKYQSMPAITGNAKLSSSFNLIREKILDDLNYYGYVQELNRNFGILEEEGNELKAS